MPIQLFACSRTLLRAIKVERKGKLSPFCEYLS